MFLGSKWLYSSFASITKVMIFKHWNQNTGAQLSKYGNSLFEDYKFEIED